MSQHATTSYDELLYPSETLAQTHPDNLATLATLFGLKPAPVVKCRVLELGCGDGTNLIAMAYTLPGSEFHGLDLAARPVQNGNQLIAALGLKNITLQPGDILQAPPDWGQFDYIIAHGIYSWVPVAVRDKILSLCQEHLAPHGVAYVSYNAYPGNHIRDLIRYMMKFHGQQFPEPRERIRQARALVKFAAEAKPQPELWQTILKQQFERIVKYSDGGFFHDELSPINNPVYFSEFIEHAARYRLRYLTEANLAHVQDDGFTPEVTTVLRQLERGNIIAREQYLDFLVGRCFRQTLLCREDVELDRALNPERIFDLFIAGDTHPASASPEISTLAQEVFQGPNKAELATSHPVGKAALVHLGRIWPQHIHFQELLAVARQHAGRPPREDPAGAEQDARDLGELLVRSYAVGFVELHSQVHPFTTNVSERPTASRLARAQMQQGRAVSTLRHLALRLEDPLGQHLLCLLDGTHDHAALVAHLTELVCSGAARLQRDGQPVTDPAEVPELLAAQLPANLQSLARLALLVA